MGFDRATTTRLLKLETSRVCGPGFTTVPLLMAERKPPCQADSLFLHRAGDLCRFSRRTYPVRSFERLSSIGFEALKAAALNVVVGVRQTQPQTPGFDGWKWCF